MSAYPQLPTRPRIVAVVQARLSSHRLPGKALQQLADRTVLDWVVGRARFAEYVDQVVVATTTESADDDLVAHCREFGYPVVRGARDDVLDRMVTAAASERADIVVRLAGDCPLIDPALIDQLIDIHRREHRDYTTNSLPEPHPRTYPVGLDIEVVNMPALTEAWTARTDRRHRIDVTPYLYEEPGRFNVRIVDSPTPAGDLCWSVSTGEDLARLRALVVAADARLSTPWTELIRVGRDQSDGPEPPRGVGELGRVS